MGEVVLAGVFCRTRSAPSELGTCYLALGMSTG